MAAEPYEFIVSNVMLSVLKMVREESEEVRLGGEDLSQYDLLNVNFLYLYDIIWLCRKNLFDKN